MVCAYSWCVYAIMPGLLSSWMSDSPQSPRLTWYGSSSNRIELSGHVLANWVIKMTQALDDLAETESGTRVLLDLPPHWRSVAWALAVWTSGACVVLPAEAGPFDDGSPHHAIDNKPVDVVITDAPSEWEDFAADGGVLMAQSMDDLALSWRGTPLPPGVIDAIAEILGYPDRVESIPIPLDSDPALVASNRDPVAFAGLPTWAAVKDPRRLMESTHRSGGRPTRVLASPGSTRSLLAKVISAFGNGGTLVVVPPHMNDAQRESIAEQEGVAEVW